MSDEIRLQCELEQLAGEIVIARRDLRRLMRRRALNGGRVLFVAVALVMTMTAVLRNLSAQNDAEPYVVVAPFTVVDDKGKTIFRVENSHKIYVANKAGKSVAAIAEFGGGQITASADMKTGLSAVMYSSAAGLGMTLFQDGQPAAVLGEDTKEGSLTNHGHLSVFAKGRKFAVASLTITDLRGVASVYDKAGRAIATLTESDKIAGVGRVKISSAQLDGVFTAGWTGEGGDACAKRGNAMECLRPQLPLSKKVQP